MHCRQWNTDIKSMVLCFRKKFKVIKITSFSKESGLLDSSGSTVAPALSISRVGPTDILSLCFFWIQ